MPLIEIYSSWKWLTCENVMVNVNDRPNCNHTFQTKEQIRQWCWDEVYNLIKPTDYVRVSCDRNCQKFFN